MSYHYYGLGQISPWASTAVPVSSVTSMPTGGSTLVPPVPLLKAEIAYKFAPTEPIVMEPMEFVEKPAVRIRPPEAEPTYEYTPPKVVSMTSEGPSSSVFVPDVEMPYKPKPSPPPPPGNGNGVPGNGNGVPGNGNGAPDLWTKCMAQGKVPNYVTNLCDPKPSNGNGNGDKKAGVGTVAVVGAAALAALLLIRR